MYELTVRSEFCAAHAIVMKGEREVVHGHNFQVVVCVRGGTLDGDGLLCDFHLVESVLKEVIEPFHNANLNATPPFDRVNPTAENLARYLADEVQDRVSARAGHAWNASTGVSWVSVSEAPGCIATYRRDGIGA
jgi:6-pyruvoyltetrahydropterin/6-carboxytetrahydropterin synthase